MNRLNGRLASAPPVDTQDFEPSCLVRTPSGNVYIPTGTLNHPKNTGIDYKQNSSCSTPCKEIKTTDRLGTVPYGTSSHQIPVMPVRNNLRRPNSTHFPQASRFHFHKGMTSKCSWKCTAIVFIMLSVLLLAITSYISASSLLSWSYQTSTPCTVLVGDNSQVIPAPKKAPSETNLAPSSRPKTVTTGGNYIGRLQRKRRDVDGDEPKSHVDVLTTSSVSTSVVHATHPTYTADSLVLTTSRNNEDLYSSGVKRSEDEVKGPLGLEESDDSPKEKTEASNLRSKSTLVIGDDEREASRGASVSDYHMKVSTEPLDIETITSIENIQIQNDNEGESIERNKGAEISLNDSDTQLNNNRVQLLASSNVAAKHKVERKTNETNEAESPLGSQMDQGNLTVGAGRATKLDSGDIPVNEDSDADQINGIMLPPDPQLDDSKVQRTITPTSTEKIKVFTTTENAMTQEANPIELDVELMQNDALVDARAENFKEFDSYEDSDVDIVKLNNSYLTDTQKIKTNYDHNSTEEKSKFPNVNDFNKPFVLHETLPNKTEDNVKETPTSTVTVIEIPTSGHINKRIVVNVTITTEQENFNKNEPQSVYVVSVAVPSDDLAPNISEYRKSAESTTPPPKPEEKHNEGGGGCECSCPSVDVSDIFGDFNTSDYYDEDISEDPGDKSAESYTVEPSKSPGGRKSSPGDRSKETAAKEASAGQNSSANSRSKSPADSSTEGNSDASGGGSSKADEKSGAFVGTSNHPINNNDGSFASSTESPVLSGGIISDEDTNLTENDQVSIEGTTKANEDIEDSLVENGDYFADKTTTSAFLSTESPLRSITFDSDVSSHFNSEETNVGSEESTASVTNTDATTSTTCPDIKSLPPPPILILEGGRTFPAQTFPPDGTTFAQISLGQRLSREIPPYGYWNMQFYQSEAAYVKFDYNIPRGASIGVYARRNALPTHTQYHILEVLSGFKARTTRASQSSMKREVTHYMEQGHWFLSLYNDDGDPQEIAFIATIADDMTHNCPNGCSGKGECLMGHCQCNPGFGGDDCSESVCPVLCSQRGEYINGECQCNPGWKGKECQLRHDECEIPDCHGHGHCANGKCNCVRGYKGKFCEQVDCPHPNCSGHGYCVEGTCLCKKGWKGPDCSTMDKEALQCLPDCSGHGTFNLDTQTCSCEPRWSGDDCSKELCDLDCGNHGHCVSDSCECDAGWSGELCNMKECDSRCNEHGQCKNGTCLCVTGWNGKHCTMEGCPNSCSTHGQCRFNSDSMWECRCDSGWDGSDCSILLEQNCNDGKDNDKDGLVDCEDPECCSNHLCNSSQLCVSSPKPIDILLRKQPPAITASFFERMKFLIDEGSLQNYARQGTFNESRSAVVRGKVVTPMDNGLMGLRVSTSTPQEGFTLTRDDGWFDLLVNGGGAVTLHFGRSPFRPQTQVVYVPWNEVVIIDDVVMTTGDEKPTTPILQPCSVHDYDQMKPVVLATWKHGFQGACPDKSSILAESQVVQESLKIPGTGLNLVYQSSRAGGYLSTIQLQLTPEVIPASLKLIHLRITIEGILFEKTFEADPIIKFTYSWNRLNVYRQRVYGVTNAIVKVGYEYRDCKEIIWDVQTTKLSGHDMSISEVGGWNLDIHHRYNFHEGILQKGDGSNIYLKHKPRVILTTMGDGHQRPLECNDCEGIASKQRLLAPVALAAAPDGSVLVGDFNLVRKILTDGTVRTVVKLNATRVSYRYHMALSPLDGTLYISDPESHQIIRVRDANDYSDPDRNWETIVGSGERCLPGDEAHCGDGALARDAKLAYPKGIAVSNDNVLYFADGTNIRMVDRDGIITTVIGNHMHKSHWKPLPCEGTLNLEEVHLRWPTELAINPLDNTLHIIDDHMILQMTQDGRVKVIAGRPLHCPSPLNGYDMELATHATLVMPQSIAFSSFGDLYIAESDSQRINRVRVIGTDGKISPYAGAESKCNCLERGCDCFDADHYLAANSKFNTISAVCVTPDGHVHIGDQANYRIRSVMASIPEASTTREYEIYSPETQEIYLFNRFGQHIATKNILTGETRYTFTYNVNTSNGKLSTVTDAAGNKVFLLRDYSSRVNSIENTKGQKCRLKMSRMHMLHELSTPDNYNVTFDYHGATGLLKTKLDSSGRSYVYSYDEFGRLTSAVTPTGKVITLSFDLSVKGATVKVGQNNKDPISLLIKGSSVSKMLGDSETKIVLHPDGSVSTITPWSHSINTDTVPYSILADKDPLLVESYPVPAKQRIEIGGDLANRFEWKYFVRPNQPKGAKTTGHKTIAKVGKRLRVNGENLLTLEYDRESSSVSVFMDDKIELINVTYDRSARPIKWAPRNDIFAQVELEYDRFSRLSSWKWGDQSESYGFDRAGRLFEIKYSDGTSLIYAFKDMFSNLPLKVTTPRGSDYLLQYDDTGALQSLTTPRGHIHTFALQTSLGFFKYQYFSPMNRHPYEIMYNDDGQILAKIYPHQSGRVSYVYDALGKLETSLAGMSSIHYTYHDTTTLVKHIEVVEPNFELKQEFKYHAGILKDERLKFNGKVGLDNAHYRYQYDGNARISGIDVDINGKEFPQLRLKYNQNMGSLEGISDLRVYRNTFNRSVMQDTSKQFFTITDYDSHGRIKTILINIKSFDVYRLELDYDNRNRIKSQQIMVGRVQVMDRFTYNSDGHILEASGSNNWKYVYDENGNIISIIKEKEKISLGYDSGDRVVQYGDVEFNSYDNRGFVVRRGEQKYRYNARGQLIHAFERDKFQLWYYYDDRGRMVSWNDDKGNVTQYFYANPNTPDLVTHLHYPKTGRTFRFLYDSRNIIITVETLEQRFYIGSDQNGSPIAIFDTNGNLIKEIRRTPFGSIILDTNPDFYLPVDFQGGILDPNTKLIYINKRLYDPVVGQWMTPAWEQLATKLTTPTDVFIYRFRNNDPVNYQHNVDYMTDLNSWLRMYGYDLDGMRGSYYVNRMIYKPQATVHAPQLAPDFGVMSGLGCIVEKINEMFSSLSFVPKPLLKMEPKTRNLLPRVSYRKSVFGEGVLISNVGGRALVSVVDGVNGVVQDVVTSVFNNSFFLDLHFNIHDQDVFYFVKDNALKIRDDLEELRRLGGMFNVSTHEVTGEHNAMNGFKELRLHNPDAMVIVKYGIEPMQEKHRILRHAHKRAVERAWEVEKQLVAAGFQGRGEWTEEEKEELISHGDVDGYEGIDIHSIHKYPQLADDPGNVAFQRDTKRKRRKSGLKRQRLHRHES